MEQPVLSNPEEFPSESIIFSHIGKTKALWLSLFEYIHSNHPDFVEEWRYYRDGKSWLLKVTRKKKTIFWLSIIKGSFRTTFYFTDKAEEPLMSSDLSDELKNQFKSGNPLAKIKGVTVVYRSGRDIEDARILVGIKIRMK